MRFPLITNIMLSIDVRSNFDQIKEFPIAKETAKIAAGILVLGAIGSALYLANRPIGALPVVSLQGSDGRFPVDWGSDFVAATAVTATAAINLSCSRS